MHGVVLSREIPYQGSSRSRAPDLWGLLRLTGKSYACSWDKDLMSPTSSSTCSRTGAAAPPEHLNATALALSMVTSQDVEKGPNPFESLLLQSFGSSTVWPCQCVLLTEDKAKNPKSHLENHGGPYLTCFGAAPGFGGISIGWVSADHGRR